MNACPICQKPVLEESHIKIDRISYDLLPPRVTKTERVHDGCADSVVDLRLLMECAS